MTTNLKIKPTTTLDPTETPPVKWVRRDPLTERQYTNLSEIEAEETREYIKLVRNWRKDPLQSFKDKDAIFPDKDSNENPCLILFYDWESKQAVSENLPWLSVIYPDGTTRKLLQKRIWQTHSEEAGHTLTYSALAALAAWAPGDTRSNTYRWQRGAREASNASNTITEVMWVRAIAQGYITMSPGETYIQGKAVRTSKKVQANLKKSRKTKKSAWPFSEKVHWFNIMSGALQISNTNITEVLASESKPNHKKIKAVRENFPVFETCADFKKARKFFEVISEKKHPDSALRNLVVEDHYPKRHPQSYRWDPFKCIATPNVSTRTASRSLFSNPYTLVKTSMMLGCVPKVEEDGRILDYQEITSEYIKKVGQEQPMRKFLVGIWQGATVSRSRYVEQHTNFIWDEYILNNVNIDNLTHMYMVMLNETQLLSNEDLVKWCSRQSLTLCEPNFNTNFIPTHNHEVFGYKLTDSLNYTCVVWGKPLLDSTENEETDHAY